MTAPKRPTQPTQLIDAYIDALRHDLNAPPPPGLDADTAHAARALVAAEMGDLARRKRELSPDARARMWQQTLDNLERGDSPKDGGKMQLTMRNAFPYESKASLRSQMMAFAALIAVVAFAAVMLARLDYAPIPPDDEGGFIPALAGSENPDEQRATALAPTIATATPIPANVLPAAQGTEAGLCATLLQLGDFDGAMIACRAALTADDHNPDVWALLGQAQYLSRSYEEAARSFEICLDLGGTDVRCDYLRGLAYTYLGECDRAWEALYGMYTGQPVENSIMPILVEGLNNLRESCPRYADFNIPVSVPTATPLAVTAAGGSTVALLPIEAAVQVIGDGGLVVLEGIFHIEGDDPAISTIMLSDETGSIQLEMMNQPSDPVTGATVSPIDLTGTSVVAVGILSLTGDVPTVQVYSLMPAQSLESVGLVMPAADILALTATPMALIPVPTIPPPNPVDPAYAQAQAVTSRLLPGAMVVGISEQGVFDDARLLDVTLDNGVLLYMVSQNQSLEVYALQWGDGAVIPTQEDSQQWLDLRGED